VRKCDLISKILRRKDLLSLRVRKGGWTESNWPGSHDLRVSISLAGRDYCGRGIDEDSELAFLKGFSEAVEHAFCHHYLWESSTGVSCHQTQIEATKHSMEELKERTLLDNYLELKLSPQEIKFEAIEKWSNFSQYKKNLRLLGFESQFFILNNDRNGFGVLNLQSTKDTTFSGIAFKESLEEAIKHSYLEALTNTVAFINDESVKAQAIDRKSFEITKFTICTQPLEALYNSRILTQIASNPFVELNDLPLVLARSILGQTSLKKVG